jgi:WD40 repeat protein
MNIRAANTVPLMITSLLALVAACRSGGEVSASPDIRGKENARQAPAVASTPQTPAPPKAAAAPVAPIDDVLQLPTRTSAGGAVFQLGIPRLRIAAGGLSRLQVSRSGKIAALSDHPHSISVWDLSSGALIRRLRNPKITPQDSGQFFVLSPKGTWLAVSFNVRLFLFKAPFDGPPISTPCYGAHAFSADESKLLCSTAELKLLDIATNQIIATAPDSCWNGVSIGLTFSSDQKSAYCITQKRVARWDFSTGGTVSEIYTSPATIERFSMASGAPVLLLREDGKFSKLDLLTGKKDFILQIGYEAFVALPSGKEALMRTEKEVLRIDLQTKVPTPLAKVQAGIGDLAYAQDADLLVLISSSPFNGIDDRYQIQILDLATGLRTYPAPTRFAAWLPDSSAALEKDGLFSTLILSTGARGTTDAATFAALAPKPPLGAPAWASWISAGPSGQLLLAEPRPRSKIVPDLRYASDCEPTFRLWIPGKPGTGKEKILINPCTDQNLVFPNADAGWFLDAGWILGLSTRVAALFNAKGALVAQLSPGTPSIPKKEFRHEFWNAAFSPTGKHLALLWHRADYGGDAPRPSDPREDVMHRADDLDRIDCQRDRFGDCKLEAFLEIWSLGPRPRRLWKERFSLPATANRTLLEPKLPSGALAFDRTGQRLLVGFRDGDILIRSLSDKNPDLFGAKATAPLESLHQVPVTRISVSPDNRWVFSEDASAEQRLWALPP